MTAATCSWRSATMSSASVSGERARAPSAGASRAARMVRPRAVPPGSRVTSGSTPLPRRNRAARSTCVDLPEPSMPSNVMKTPATPPPAREELLLLAALRGRRALRGLHHRGLGLRCGGPASLLAVADDELLDHRPRLVVGELHRRRLLEVGRGADERALEAVVERQLGAAHGV